MNVQAKDSKDRMVGSFSSVPLLRRSILLGILPTIFLCGCAATSGPRGGSAVTGNSACLEGDSLSEKPGPDGPWRPHRLAHCAEDVDVPPTVERYLGTCSEYFRHGSGSDGMIELEIALEEGIRHPLLLLTLGQLYLLAGQGDPALLPAEGPAADVGDWPRNKRRLLSRARKLLLECAEGRPDDAAVDFLLADVARAGEQFSEAAELVLRGEAKCTGGRSFRVMKLYQELNDYPPSYLSSPPPEYPEQALWDGVTGEVVLDLLLNPTGQVRQAVEVSSPSPDLTRAAEASLCRGIFESARIGKYPLWSWLRVKTAFNLEGP